MSAMRRSLHTERAGTQDSTLLGGLADLSGPVLAKFRKEILMRFIAGFTVGGPVLPGSSSLRLTTKVVTY